MIPEHDNIKRYCCQDCDSIFYTNPNNVVGALCIRDNKILMAKRDINPRKIKMAYSMFSLPHINQVHMFFLADLLDDNYGPTFESSDVRLFDIDEILWDEIAFPTVKKTLEYYIEDLKKGDFIFREEDIKLW